MSMHRPRVKFCGITRPEDAAAAAALGVDAIGLVFVPASPRCVSISRARQIVEQLPPMVTVVGLFMDQPAAEVRSVCDEVPIEVLQFHGRETPDYCAAFGRPWWKALTVNEDGTVPVDDWSAATALLLDAHRPGGMGGTGRTLDWRRIIPPARPWILAGGLNPSNVAEAVALLAPPAVDVSSGIETAPGRKDARLMALFMESIANGTQHGD
ncbi:MAG: phosphoribosylanthranilate isomerase [Wenzhouxiangellaceae bacterium]